MTARSTVRERPLVDVVLVRPENAVNVGAVARVMRNTGLRALRLVNPCDFRTVEAWRTAWGAHDVLEGVRQFETLGAAIEGYDDVVALSGREGSESDPVDVREMAGRFAGMPAGRTAAMVFGPETAGLSEEEIRLCGARARIPTDPAQPSLNLSHAVMVAGYEVLRAGLSHASSAGEPATRAEREALAERLRAGLVSIAALAADDDRYFKRWRTFLLKTPMSPRDVSLFEHMVHKMIAAGPRS